MSELTQTKTVDIEPDAWIRVVSEKLKHLRFGVVLLIVHDGQIVQIERTERTRLEPAPRRSAPH